jgi:hypothetical protein
MYINCRNKRHKNCFSKNNNRFTVVLSYMADGGGINSVLIFKRKTIPKIKFPAGDFVHTQKAKWMKKE